MWKDNCFKIYFISLLFLAIFISPVFSPTFAGPVIRYDLLAYDSANVKSIEVKSIIDSRGYFHSFFLVTDFDYSFTLYHFFNNRFSVVDRGFTYSDGLQALYSLSNGDIVLFYIIRESEGFDRPILRSLRLHSSAVVKEDITVLLGEGSYVQSKLFFDSEEDSVNIFILSPSSPDITVVSVYNFDLNGLSFISNNTLPLSTKILDSIVDVFSVDNNYYLAYTEISSHNSTINFARIDESNLTVVCSVAIPYYLTDVIIKPYDFDLSSPEVYLLISSYNNDIFSSIISLEEGHTYNYTSFQHVDLSFYRLSSYYHSLLDESFVFVFENVSYTGILSLISTISVPENAPTTVGASLILLKDNYTHIEVSAQKVISNTISIFLRRSSLLFTEDGNFALISSWQPPSQFRDYIFDTENVVLISLYSNIEDLAVHPKGMLTLGVKLFTPFGFFIKKYWYVLVIPLILIAVLALVFYRHVISFFRRVKSYLLRPISPDKSAFRLILINSYLFVVNSFVFVYTFIKKDKKRFIFNVLSLSLIVTIVLTIVTLPSLKEEAILINQTKDLDLAHNGVPSVTFSIKPKSLDLSNVSVAEKVILSSIMVEISYYDYPLYQLINGYYWSLKSSCYFLQGDATNFIKLTGLREKALAVLQEFLIQGALPSNTSEIIISSELASLYNLNVGDTIKLVSGAYFGNESLPFVSVRIAGIYKLFSDYNLKLVCRALGVSSDIISYLSGGRYDVFTSVTSFFSIIDCFSEANDIDGTVEFIYNFNNLEKRQLKELVELNDKMVSSSPFIFGGNPVGIWYFHDELSSHISDLYLTFTLMEFAVLFLSVPLVFLGLFLLSKLQKLFEESQKQEINVLRTQGLSTLRILYNYLNIRTVELLGATLLGAVLSSLLLLLLSPVNSFIGFSNEAGSFTLSPFSFAVPFVFFALLFLSVPDLIRISYTKETVIKSPRRIRIILKRLSYFPIFYIAFGGGLAYLAISLTRITAGFNVGKNIMLDTNILTLISIFQYLFGIGIMIVFLGVGLLLEQLHRFTFILLSKLIWGVKKTFNSFSLVNVRSELRVYSRNFLMYALFIWLITPAILIPVFIQDQVKTMSQFYAGSDLYIENAHMLEGVSVSSLLSYPEIESLTNFSVYTFSYYDIYQFRVAVIDDIPTFLSAVHKPPNWMITDWEAKVTNLTEINNILVSFMYYFSIAHESKYVTLFNGSSTITLRIISYFDYFPIFYDKGHTPDNPYDYKLVDYLAMVVSSTTFEFLTSVIADYELMFTNVLIKASSKVDRSALAFKISKETGIPISTVDEKYDETMSEYYPFYPLIAAEELFTLLISLIAVVLTSIANPIQMLAIRKRKNSILKRIGLPSKEIINLSVMEELNVSILPGVIIGTLFVGATMSVINYLLLSSPNLPHYFAFNPVILLLVNIFLALLYLSLYYLVAKRNFSKFRLQTVE